MALPFPEAGWGGNLVVFGSSRGGQSGGHRKGSAERREQEMKAGAWDIFHKHNSLGFHLCGCSLCQPRHGNSRLFPKPQCKPENILVCWSRESFGRDPKLTPVKSSASLPGSPPGCHCVLRAWRLMMERGREAYDGKGQRLLWRTGVMGCPRKGRSVLFDLAALLDRTVSESLHEPWTRA